MSKSRRAVLALSVLLALWLTTPTRAEANVGAPYSGGQLAGEPAGVADVAIAREDLVIDMRPLATGGLVDVVATYHLEGRGPDRRLELVFAAGAADITNVRVTLDGRSVATRSPREAALPVTWRAPTSTPRPGGAGTLLYEVGHGADASAFGFDLDLAAGRHELVVAYSADAMLRHVGEPTVVRQFAYVLAPARTWDGFGGLDVTVHVPPGWVAGASPALRREGDTLRGAFASLPADAVALSIQAPSRAFGMLRVTALIALGLVTMAGAALVSRGARRRAKAGSARSTLGAIALGAGWSAAFFVVGSIAIFAPAITLADGVADRRGYGQAIAMLALVLGATFVFTAGVALAVRAGRRADA